MYFDTDGSNKTSQFTQFISDSTWSNNRTVRFVKKLFDVTPI